jgi:hypothetical protein
MLFSCLLKQQSSITVYRLPTKEDKFPFSVSVYSKQTEVFRFFFPLAENKRKLPFSDGSVSVCGSMETWRHKRIAEPAGNFLNPFTVCSLCLPKFVVCPFVDKEQTEVIRLQTD